MVFLLKLRRSWRLLVILLSPFILLPIPLLIHSIQARCAYIILLVTVYWVSEAMPYAVTSLLPLVLFPMLNIIPGDTIGHNYFEDVATLFLGSMALAHAMEHVHLHRRLALFVLSFVGSSVKWSMAGLMCVTAFFSMWIANSAATSIMMPAAIAIVDELESYEKKTFSNRRQSREMVPLDTEVVFDTKTMVEGKHEPKQMPNTTNSDLNEELTPFNSIPKSRFDYGKLKAGFLISVAYSAAFGGLITLVGTGPNIFVKGFIDQIFEDNKNVQFEISFANFFLFAFPIGALMLIFSWLWLQILYNRADFFRWKINEQEAEREKYLKSILKQQYNESKSLQWQEIIIIFLFVILIALWIIRDFSSENWLFIFRKEYATDGTIALFIGTLPLILPDKNPFQDNWHYKPILPWSHLSATFPWGIFMLQGAGLAISDGFEASDLSSTLATSLRFIVDAPRTVIILFVIIISSIYTEFSNNLACASILFPIWNSIATVARIHPAHLIMPSCITVSMALMLPTATPPNAIILANSNVRIADLIKAGIVLKLIGIIVVFVESILLLSFIFGIDDTKSIYNSTMLENTTIKL